MRNLSAAQIVEQLVEARRLLRELPDAGGATNIVFMGMGALAASLARHCAPQLSFSASRTPPGCGCMSAVVDLSHVYICSDGRECAGCGAW